LGTPTYLSPEQVQCSTFVGPRSDLYGLGGILYEMLTGAPPFSGNATEILRKHLKAHPRAPRSLIPEIPERLERLVLALLEKDPERRPASAAAVAAELDAILLEP